MRSGSASARCTACRRGSGRSFIEKISYHSLEINQITSDRLFSLERFVVSANRPRTGGIPMSLPDVVSREQWLEARRQLLAREKEYTRSRDALNADRRRLPMVAVDQEYVFEGPDGPVTLADLFGGKRQLIVQHVMYGPDWEQPCPGCSASLDELSQGILDHLGTRETAFALTARAPYDKIAAKAKERGWSSFPWYSSFASEFNYDYGVTLDAARGLVDYN